MKFGLSKYLLLTVLLCSQTVFAGRFEDFAPEEQDLIRKFYLVATGFGQRVHNQKKQIAIHQAKEMIETALQLKTKVSVSDLLTTRFDIKAQRSLYEEKNGANFLLDYGTSTYKNSEFFDYTLQYIQKQNIDTVKDDQGRTILMRLADNRPSTVMEKESEDKIALHCFESLLAKNVNLNLQDSEGHDVLSIALLSRNMPIVNLIKAHLQKNNTPSLNEKTQTLLDIHEGKFVDVNSSKMTSLEQDMYRVANQSQNFKMVDALYCKFRKQEFEDFFENIKPAYYFYPPLWAYNISQMKEYAISIVKQLQENVIDESKVTCINERQNLWACYEGKNDFYQVNLVKKDRSIVGRILGRNHLERIIQEENLQDHIAVPRKFLTVPNGNLKNVKVHIQVPSARALDEPLHITNSSIHIEFEGATLYAESIKADKVSRNLAADDNVKKVAEKSGFRDIGRNGDNYIQSQKDGKIYFIDTEDRKNFIHRNSDYPHNNTEIKSFNFDPRIECIDIQLSEKDFE